MILRFIRIDRIESEMSVCNNETQSMKKKFIKSIDSMCPCVLFFMRLNFTVGLISFWCFGFHEVSCFAFSSIRSQVSYVQGYFMI